MSDSKTARDNRANQLNPTHPAYHRSRGAAPQEAQRMADEHRMSPNGAPNEGAIVQESSNSSSERSE